MVQLIYMKTRITVVGAAIVKDGKLLALRRADGNEEVIHKFEFAGGKVEEGETPCQALERECMEELSMKVEVGELLNTLEYDYPSTSVRLSVYFVKPLSDYKLTVHEEDKWFDFSSLDASEWAPADKPFLSSLKKGYVKNVKAESEKDFKCVYDIACEVMHETYDGIIKSEAVDYIINIQLTPEIMAERTKEKGYTYNLICLNGEEVGFTAYCPASSYDPALGAGTFLSKLYIKKFARGKKIASKVFAGLNRPLYLTVKQDNNLAVSIYKHCGFKILRSVTTDIGNGATAEDFLMVLGN